MVRAAPHRPPPRFHRNIAPRGGAAGGVGACVSHAGAVPLDVVKTRIQNRPFDSPESGASIIKNLIKNEPPRTCNYSEVTQEK